MKKKQIFNGGATHSYSLSEQGKGGLLPGE